MNNHEIINLNYKRHDFTNIFTDSENVLRPCTSSEIIKISILLGLPFISRVLYFSITPYHYSAIHIDKTINSTNSLEFALNIPITTCDNIYMNWFDNLSNTHSIYYPVDKAQATPILESKNAKTIDTVNLNLPMFVKINDWHNIENRSNSVVGKLISIRFSHAKTIPDIKKALKIY